MKCSELSCAAAMTTLNLAMLAPADPLNAWPDNSRRERHFGPLLATAASPDSDKKYFFSVLVEARIDYDEFWNPAGLSDNAIEDIFWNNAAALFGLKEE